MDSPIARLVPLVYAELRRVAGGHLRREGRGHSIQPTMLVPEAYPWLADAEVDWRNRTDFVSVAANVMRRILVERARARLAYKRGGEAIRVTLSDRLAAPESRSIELLMLDQAFEDEMCKWQSVASANKAGDVAGAAK